jgi:FG-GAP repeat
MRSTLRVLVPPMVLTAFAAGQELVWSQAGTVPLANFGTAVAGLGDLDGDGRPDFAVGAPGPDPGAAFGFVTVHGSDGGLLFRLSGQQLDDSFGAVVRGAGDLTGDGVPDILVAAPAYSGASGNAAGAIFAYSGVDGGLLWSFEGEQAFDLLGYGLAGTADLNGDGYRNVVVGAHEADTPAGARTGRAYVLDWQGNLLWTLDGKSSVSRFGWTIDGSPDGASGVGFVIGAPGDSTGGPYPTGTVYVYDTAGSLLWSKSGPEDGESFGFSVASTEDLDGDGLRDVIVGATNFKDPNTFAKGRVLAYSATGGLLWSTPSPEPGGAFGLSLAALGDVNGDCVGDVGVGNHYGKGQAGNAAGRAYVLSGRGGLLWEIEGEVQGQWLGFSMAGAGDVDGDGLGEVLIGGPRFGDGGGAQKGKVYLYSGGGAGEVYCTAKVNSQGCTPAIHSAGRASASDAAPFLISADGILNNQPGFLLYSSSRDITPFQGGLLCVGSPVLRTPLLISGGNPPPDDCSGVLSRDFNAWIQGGFDPALTPGAVVYAQFWYRDPQDPNGIGLSDALRFTICP